MSEKHTPGPWEISHEPPRWIIQAEAAIGKKAVAFMVGDYLECSANAHLIAAAPTMKDEIEGLRRDRANANGALRDANETILLLLEALKELLDAEGDVTAYENGDIDNPDGIYERIEAARSTARAALSKAKGG